MSKTELALNNAKIMRKAQKKVRGKPFQKGHHLSKGRPKGSLNEVTKFKEAIKVFEKEQQKSIYKILLNKALVNPQVLIAIFKALIPQKSESSIKVENIGRPYKDLSDEELVIKANEIFNRTTASRSRRDISRA